MKVSTQGVGLLFSNPTH